MTSWAYGVTTVPQRINDLLPRTLASLAGAGFDKPRLFVDGMPQGLETPGDYEKTLRVPVIKTFGNWCLGLAELYLREPLAGRYAMFQDDLIAYRNLRQYLDQCIYPEKGYWNLYTVPRNQKLVDEIKGWGLSNQRGKGAIALVFSREAVLTLLGHTHMLARPQNPNPRKNWKSIDGGIVTAFELSGWKEYVHNPSLVQHVGTETTMGNFFHPVAVSFRGENFDAMELV